MPDFNTLHINEDLLGKVISAKKKGETTFNHEEAREVKNLYNEYLKKQETKTIGHIIREFFLGKKLAKFKGSDGFFYYREKKESDEYVPILKIEKTTERPIDFKGNLFRWLVCIKAERKRLENEVKKENKTTTQQIENAKRVINFINNRMLKIS
ncbi:MAG: hypothetical protein KatS3mg035_1001 [Bacteroidia bacterium]|nr:MAG: hypothetical protein KatS3mg035_1001 [Bacteroidia bacterium]